MRAPSRHWKSIALAVRDAAPVTCATKMKPASTRNAGDRDAHIKREAAVSLAAETLKRACRPINRTHQHRTLNVLHHLINAS